MKIADTASYSILPMCLACGSPELIPLLDLGYQPLANAYISNKAEESFFPLSSRLCTQCFHAQQSIAVRPNLMFENYPYVSGTSKTLQAHFEWLAEHASLCLPERKNSAVLSIASNDGSELLPFIRRGWQCTGVDPAANLAEQARKTGADIIVNYWNKQTAEHLDKKFDVIIAQNVCAHVADPLEFLMACALAMHNSSVLFVQTSQARMFERNEFDTMYHEHISFFSARSMHKLAQRAGLVLSNVQHVPIHGESYLFTLTLGGTDSTTATEVIEEGSGRYAVPLYQQFALNAEQVAHEARVAVEKARTEGYRVVGYGAAAKGNTVLNYAGIHLDWIVDDNPLKQGLMTPGMHIPIVDSSYLATVTDKLMIIPLAWNFLDEIRTRVGVVRPDSPDAFLTFFPTVRVVP